MGRIGLDSQGVHGVVPEPVRGRVFGGVGDLDRPVRSRRSLIMVQLVFILVLPVGDVKGLTSLEEGPRLR